MTGATRILLVEDDKIDRMIVRAALEKSGLDHELVEAADGASGLRCAKERAFDCVLLGYLVAGGDAFDVLTVLLSPEGGAHAVVVLTGDADDEAAGCFLRAGAFDTLPRAEVTPPNLARVIRYAKARRAFAAELETARREAEDKSRAFEALRRQTTFLFSVIAHDLRNPFQALLGLSSLLERAVSARNFGSIDRYARSLGDATTRTFALIEGLLSWVGIQMDTTVTSLVGVDLAEIARATVADANEAAAAKNLSFHIACPNIQVRARADTLATVLRNLVSNAVKFTEPGGTISITASPRGDVIEIEVTDSGIGMPAERISNLFQLEKRFSTMGTAGEPGSGFGLLSCRDLVERLGGELTVSSVVARGTTFRFSLERERILSESPAA